ncbi:MAG: response regulator transcription factor [Ardenticatenaceae bacterium]
MNKIRVLLIDDHPAIRAGIRVILEQDPSIEVVGEADNGDRAVELVKLLKPDVLLLDMEMPGKNGPEVAQELNRINANVHILGLSAHDNLKYIKRLLENGADGYLTKEEALDKIVEAVHGVMRGQKGWFSRRALVKIMAQTQKKKEKKDVRHLTPKEKEVLNGLIRGLSNNEIALELKVRQRTIKFHLSNIYEKMGVNSRTKAVALALEHDLV